MWTRLAELRRDSASKRETQRDGAGPPPQPGTTKGGPSPHFRSIAPHRKRGVRRFRPRAGPRRRRNHSNTEALLSISSSRRHSAGPSVSTDGPCPPAEGNAVRLPFGGHGEEETPASGYGVSWVPRSLQRSLSSSRKELRSLSPPKPRLSTRRPRSTPLFGQDRWKRKIYHCYS